MVNFGAGHARGILHRLAPAERFHHARHPAAGALAAFVQHYWIVRWHLAGHPPQLQETLPHPNVYLVFEPGLTGVHGVAKGRYTRVLDGDSFAFGVKFRPGGFRPFLGRAVSTLTGRSLPLETVFGARAAGLERAVLDAADEHAMIALVRAFLLERLPPPDPEVARVAGIVDGIAADRGLTRVDALAERHGLGLRALQRLFGDYVGVGPKWVINRYRLHEAVDQLAEGRAVDWTALALDLGYFDQAHFIRDFRALVGRTPGDFARDLNARRA
ncbi:AraC family transcriptional regulator [Dokdonella sp.]|uniref:AraC family transcriptional regulator n=1 Tax=Dokdonella sp. TaxID=2291710 RepID=UPI002F4156B5